MSACPDSSGPSRASIVIIASGSGSNAQALIEASKQADSPFQVAAVFSNRADAYVLERARKHKIPAHLVASKDYKNSLEFEQILHEKIVQFSPDLICLAGFMRILSNYFISRWPEKIVNIHPSILPKYKGLNTHQRALDNGDKMHGCTVHYVNEKLDAGPIILQRKIRINKDESADSLAARLLKEEHIAYPDALRLILKK